jgi:hypothetical protein
VSALPAKAAATNPLFSFLCLPPLESVTRGADPTEEIHTDWQAKRAGKTTNWRSVTFITPTGPTENLYASIRSVVREKSLANQTPLFFVIDFTSAKLPRRPLADTERSFSSNEASTFAAAGC